MVTRQELEGKWNEVKGRLQEKWGQLTDDELQKVKGNANELVGVIQQRTGESRRAIEDFIQEAVGKGAKSVNRAVETAREYAEQGTEAMREGYDQVSENLRAGQEQVRQMVQQNPMESVAVAFGAGIITGVVVGLMLKSR